MKTDSTGKYRADIDGLRALAVLSILVYHLDKAWMPGGYVGVDIFFVISGYLITGILEKSIRNGSISISEFYMRRIKRIAPAFFVVVLATLLAGAALLLPEDLERLAMSAAFSSVGAANLYFWKYLDDDYFAESSDQEPLLHMWSLGVEEQFYLFWPACLLALAVLFRRNDSLKIGVVFVALTASYAWAEMTNISNPKFAYFMLPTRAGELLTGGITAMIHVRLRQAGKSSPRWFAEIATAFGLLMIVASLATMNDMTPFPGVSALVPCAGTAVILAAGSNSSLKNWVLQNRPTVAIGLMSYSIYLWHWPILAFIRYFFETVTPLAAIIATGLTLVLSWLSYRYVEQPARTVDWPRRRVFAALLLVPSLLICGAGLYVVSTDGLKSWIENSERYISSAAKMRRYTAPATEYDFNCQSSRFNPRVLSETRCLVGVPASGQPEALVIGDSHAAHYLGLLDAIAKSGSITVRNAEQSSCPPVFNGQYSYGRYISGCRSFLALVRNHIAVADYKVVALGANWPAYDIYPSFRENILGTIREIKSHGMKVVILGTVPAFKSFNRECSLRWSRLGVTRCTGSSTDNVLPEIDGFLQKIAQDDPEVTYLTVREASCDGERCHAFLDGLPLYYDRAHLSMDGSKRLGTALVESGSSHVWASALRGLADGS